jgi:hypothetical protein
MIAAPHPVEQPANNLEPASRGANVGCKFTVLDSVQGLAEGMNAKFVTISLQPNPGSRQRVALETAAIQFCVRRRFRGAAGGRPIGPNENFKVVPATGGLVSLKRPSHTRLGDSGNDDRD